MLKNAAMTGPEFRKRVLHDDGKINQDEFDKIWPSLRVLAKDWEILWLYRRVSVVNDVRHKYSKKSSI